MPRPGAVLGALLSVVVLSSGACDGSSGAGPTTATAGVAADAGVSGVPCDVDAVLARHCRQCHSAPPQFGAPMPLLTWENLHAPSAGSKKVYEVAALKVADDADPMPPEPNRRLSESEKNVLAAWAAAGAPRGEDNCETPTHSQTPLAVSCTPNLTLSPTSEWEMPADTGDEYVCWGVDLARDPATHITAFVPRVDNTRIAHHIVLYESDAAYSGTPTPCSASASISWRMVLGWAPGARGLELPPEVGFPISTNPEKPTHYVVQMHYSNPQKLSGEKDKSRIELCTSSPRKYEADVLAFGSQDFKIPAAPPQGGRYTIDCSLTVPLAFSGLRLFAAMPHMHKLGVAMSTTLVPKEGGGEVDLGTEANFSFDRQAWHALDATTKEGDVIRTRCSWVNNTGVEVGFGENTADEMCYSFTMYYPRIESPLWSWAAPALGPPIGATCHAAP